MLLRFLLNSPNARKAVCSNKVQGEKQIVSKLTTQNHKKMGRTQMSVLVPIHSVWYAKDAMQHSGNNNWKLNKGLITKDFAYSVKDLNFYIIYFEFLLPL